VDGEAPNESREPESTEPPFRADLVARIRREIETGTYETAEKWERALERLFRRLQED
jgi:hypothetical protein